MPILWCIFGGMQVRIYLTGRVGLELGGKLIVQERQFRGRQERVAFAYLVCERDRPVTREELAEVIWPGEQPPAWPTALSAIVSRLRSLLSHKELRASSVSISRGFGQYRLFLPSDTWVDLEAATSAIDAAVAALRADDPASAFGPAAIAVSIGRRPFLSGAVGGWVSLEREKLGRLRVRALECLAKVWLFNDEPALAVENAAEAVAIERLRESSHRLLMLAHASAGNPAEAIQCYHRLRRLLADELGTDPSSETEALYLKLLG